MPEIDKRVKIQKAQLKKVGDGKIKFRLIGSGLDWNVAEGSEYEVVVILRDKADNLHGADTAAVEIVEDLPQADLPRTGI